MGTLIRRSCALPLQDLLIRRSGQVVQDRPSMVAGWADIPELSRCVGCCSAAWLQYWLQSRRNGGHARGLRGLTRRLCPAAGICPVTARAVQGMAPYPGQARCLALSCSPECFRRLNVKGGRRPFPEETRSALDIEGKHVTIQGPSPDLSQAPPNTLRGRSPDPGRPLAAPHWAITTCRFRLEPAEARTPL